MSVETRKILFHALVWVALAALAYNTAGTYRFASCWQIIPLYFPPLSILLFAIFISSIAVLAAAASQPTMRAHSLFWAACHGVILTLGLVTCNLAAYTAVGHVDCL
ncbi:hypothetical protein RsS62_49170 [Rhizobium dioscoreae]|uniref:Uncharacterized protein n=1 Tax=Rhizobium dioscoreae TaxID=2653122 RepID=A0ABQ0YYC3_9HYPH|nr:MULTISPECIES: hypothetical protein [Rhizobium]ASW07220.1 hypothetical protein CKA34_15815 [Rhizobium sp. 11515TR]MCZ3377612.1 hypothetical protein [Rhizobium sp. AG207R]MDK4711688.1 hypothetical protein [Rhizobium sp. CNPSo 4039]GES45665.1 hypothetical protein RsS62_49170 [Rhizobium dioscoreae]GES48028.1 hypothetical protein RsS93_06420 [Rhizobium dioscoreae]